jgi:hypothetical protein
VEKNELEVGMVPWKPVSMNTEEEAQSSSGRGDLRLGLDLGSLRRKQQVRPEHW